MQLACFVNAACLLFIAIRIQVFIFWHSHRPFSTARVPLIRRTRVVRPSHACCLSVARVPFRLSHAWEWNETLSGQDTLWMPFAYNDSWLLHCWFQVLMVRLKGGKCHIKKRGCEFTFISLIFSLKKKRFLHSAGVESRRLYLYLCHKEQPKKNFALEPV